MAGARSLRKTGTHFSGSRPKTWSKDPRLPKCANARSRHTLQKLQIGGTSRAQGAQKGSPAKRTGHTLLIAAQYSQELPENNALFAIWLADQGAGPPVSGVMGLICGINPAQYFLE